MRTRHVRSIRRARPAPSRPGLALVLVLVALGTGATLGSAYLTSRNGSAQIASNAVQSATADWAARSAANIGVAVLQSGAQASALPTPGAVFTGMAVGSTTVNAYVTSASGQAPSATDTDLLLTTVATTGAIKTVSQRTVSYKPSARLSDAIDPEMGEYAVFAAATLRVDNKATIAVWKGSPAARLGKAAKMGLGFAGAAGLTLDSGAQVSSSLLYPSAGASASFATIAATSFAGGKVLALAPRAVGAVAPAALSLVPVVSVADQTISATQAPLPAGRHTGVYLEKGSVVTLGAAGQATSYVFEELDLRGRSVLRFEGAVTLWVKGAATIREQSAIEPGANSALVMYLGDILSLDSGAIGVDRSIALADDANISGLDPVTTRARRVRILGVQRPLALGVPTVSLKSDSVAVASIHMPNADFDVDASVIVGRVTGNNIRFRTGSSLLYDPSLDNSAGFTTFDGPLYTDAGAPIASLSTALAGFSAALGCAALPGSVQATLNTLGVVDANGIVTGGGGSSRSGRKASARDWPAAALAQEKRGVTGSGLTKGLVAAPVSVQVSDTVLTLGSGASATVQATETP